MVGLDWESIEAADRLARMSDDVMLTTEEAAAFLRISVRSLERLRTLGPKAQGPVYYQASWQGMKGVNQAVRYRLRDLRAWVEQHQVHSTLEAAGRKGQL